MKNAARGGLCRLLDRGQYQRKKGERGSPSRREQLLDQEGAAVVEGLERPIFCLGEWKGFRMMMWLMFLSDVVNK